MIKVEIPRINKLKEQIAALEWQSEQDTNDKDKEIHRRALEKLKNKLEIYKNEDKKCECWKCEIESICQYKDKYQRLPRIQGGLGLCKKIKS